MKKTLIPWLIATLTLLGSAVSVLAADAGTVLGVCGCLMQAMSDPPATTAETTLGDLTADAIRWATGADIAIVPAGEFQANLQPGEVTSSDIRLALPNDTSFITAEITPAELAARLEIAVSHITLTESYAIDQAASASGDFLQIAGFSLRYDPNMLPGERVKALRIAGEEYDLNDDQTVFIAALPDTTQADDTPAGITAAEALEAYFLAQGELGEPEGSRIYAIAVRDNDFIHTFPVVPIALSAIVFVLCARLLVRRRSS